MPKEMSVQLRDALITLKKKNNKRGTAKTYLLQVTKSMMCYILKKNECTGQLSKTKSQERPRHIIFKVYNLRVCQKTINM